MNKWFYYFGLYAWKGMSLLWRNRLLSFITWLIVTLLLVTFYIAAAMSSRASQAASKADDYLVVTADLAQDSNYRSYVDPKALALEVKKIPGVKSVKVIDEEERQRIFIKNVKPALAPEPFVFTEALTVTVIDLKYMGRVRDRIAAMKVENTTCPPELKNCPVNSVDYHAELVKKLTAFSSALRIIPLVGALVLAIVAILVVMSVTRIAIASESRSVAIMTSVGGSLWTIAAPLIIHMLTVVLAATTVASTIGWWIDPRLQKFFGNIEDLPRWLQTERSYGLFELWPYMALGSALAVSLIIGYSTIRYAKKAVH